MNDLYKQDGVDIDAGDFFSKFCNDINKGTYKISPYVKISDLSQGNFRGPKGYNFKNLPEGCVETGGMDGIGTKVVIIVAADNVFTSASNVIAMTAMDITRWGGLPLLFMNTFDVRSLGDINSETFRMCQYVMKGLEYIALREKYVLFTGETAELGLCIGSENPDAKLMFNWCGAMMGVYHPDKMILGNTLRPGQVIIALKDDFRSNGISSVRKALAMKYGEAWWKNSEATSDIFDCSSASVLYDRMLNDAHGWFSVVDQMKPKFNMHLIVHLSGGAFESKLGTDILRPMGFSAELDNLFDPPEIMEKCARWRKMQAEDCYRTWNGGQGAIVVLDSEQADDFVDFAKTYNIKAQKAGKITEKKDYTVLIHSKFGERGILKY
jgi:phosphoribosylformylglycinamidine cyclo-ligase